MRKTGDDSSGRLRCVDGPCGRFAWFSSCDGVAHRVGLERALRLVHDGLISRDDIDAIYGEDGA